MKKITFTFEDQQFTLDLERGELQGSDGKTRAKINQSVMKAIANGYAGDNFCGWPSVDITDPYRDIYQFAACMMEASLYRTYPPELEPYRPELFEEIEIRELEEKIKNAQKDQPESEHARIREELEKKYQEWKEWEAENIIY